VFVCRCDLALHAPAPSRIVALHQVSS
jgi:hypothetical protein